MNYLFYYFHDCNLMCPLRIKNYLLILLSTQFLAAPGKSFTALMLGKVEPDTNKLGNVRME
jgi:hypothetical protein